MKITIKKMIKSKMKSKMMTSPADPVNLSPIRNPPLNRTRFV